MYTLFFFFFLSTYGPAPGLSCSMQDLVPWPGIKPWPPASCIGCVEWESRVSATAPPREVHGESLMTVEPLEARQAAHYTAPIPPKKTHTRKLSLFRS